MKIQILTDNLNSWIIPYAKRLHEELKALGHKSKLIQFYNEVTRGDILVLLSCEKIVSKNILQKNKHNLVIHESALPKGKGWSPLTWQILEGKNKIPITLFEATENIDSGLIYAQKIMKFEGYELIDELRSIQGQYSIDLILDFINNYPNIIEKKQTGEESFYPRRTQRDSKLDITKTISEQFNLLRIVDNERYPAYFEYLGKKYILQIERTSDENNKY